MKSFTIELEADDVHAIEMFLQASHVPVTVVAFLQYKIHNSCRNLFDDMLEAEVINAEGKRLEEHQGI